MSIAQFPVSIKTRPSGSPIVFLPITARDAPIGGTAVAKHAPISQRMVVKVVVGQVPRNPHRTVPTGKHTAFPPAIVRDVQITGRKIRG